MEEVPAVEEIFSFGIWLRRRRRALDLTQAELAQRVGCATITIRRIEADDLRPSLEIAERLSVCLDIPEAERAAFLAAARAERSVDTLPQPLSLSLEPSHAETQPEQRTNLPFPLTNFVGRVNERAELVELLRANRLVTLTGTGGSGKTRLALQVSSDLLERFADGVWFVDLSPVRDGYFVAQAIASALDLREKVEQGIHATLYTNLRSKHLLLILDNCEHVLAACAEIADDLLRHCPELHLLITSREALYLLGEQLYPLAPLATPTEQDALAPDALLAVESVRLFYERARAAQPRFALTESNVHAIAEICRRLDGIPLAIELAAVHVRHFSAETLLERLDEPLAVLVGGPRNLPARQQTLRTTIDWSYHLLDEPERRLFMRLGLFVGGWTIESARAVWDLAAASERPLETQMAALLDKSLIRQVQSGDGHERFAMLATLQSYALERLLLSGEAEAAHELYAEYYLSLAEQAEGALAEGVATEWIRRLDQEHENLRSVLSWAFAGAEAARIRYAIRLCSALWRFWWIRGYVNEGRHWLDSALSQPQAADDPRRCANLWYGSGVLARMRGDLATATRYLNESLRLWRTLNDRYRIGLTLNSLGVVAFNQSDYAAARGFFEASLLLYRELGEANRVAIALNNLGNIAFKEGDLQQAATHYQQAMQLMDADQANKRTIALIKTNLGEIARLHKAYREAALLLHEGLTTHLELNDIENILFCLNNLVEIALDQGQMALAAQVLGAADALYEQSGAGRSPVEAQDYERQVAVVRHGLRAELFERAWSRGRSRPLDQLIAEAIHSILQESL
jgi:predicted ATPase/transcriptional regulator with XRE-family HTH domain